MKTTQQKLNRLFKVIFILPIFIFGVLTNAEAQKKVKGTVQVDSLTVGQLTNGTATTGQILQFNGTTWTPWTSTYISSYTETDPLSILNQTLGTQFGNYRINGYGAVGKLSIGTNLPTSAVNFYNTANLTGNTTFSANNTTAIVQSDVTSAAYGYFSNLGTQATAFTLPLLRHFYASQGSIGAGSSVTTQAGFSAENTLVGGTTNNYGFYGNLPINGTINYNLYMTGTAPNYLNGALGIGTTAISNVNLRISKPITGSVGSYGVISDGQLQSDVTSQAAYFRTSANTVATTFTLASLAHFNATQAALGAGSAITTQSGFEASSTLTSATNNYGFRGGLLAATGRYNLYMEGTANNYLAGRLSIGSLSFFSTTNFTNALPITGATTAYGNYTNAAIQSDVTAVGVYNATLSATQATSFTLPALVHYQASQGTFGAGSTVTTQIGFNALNTMIGATNNQGFRGQIASGTGRYNLYMDGTAQNWLRGNLAIGVTASQSNLLYIDAGTISSITPLAQFNQNGGNVQIGSGTSTAGSFIPTIRGVAAVDSTAGLYLVGQGANGFTDAAIVLRANNAAGTGQTTSGNILSVKNGANELFRIGNIGNIVIPNLASLGTSLVTANPIGGLGITPTSTFLTTETDPTAIKNQNSSAQTANYWISGMGMIGTSAGTLASLLNIGATATDGWPSTYKVVNITGNVGIAGSLNATSTIRAVTGLYSNSIFANSGTSITLGAGTENITVPVLSSGGDKMVVAMSTGQLTTQALPPTLDYGTYTPTTSCTPTGTGTPSGFTFMRVGNIVHVAGIMAVSGFTAGITQVSTSLPIASNLGSSADCIGVVTGNGLAGVSPNLVNGNPATDVALIQFFGTTGTVTLYVHFQYQIL